MFLRYLSTALILEPVQHIKLDYRPIHILEDHRGLGWGQQIMAMAVLHSLVGGKTSC